MLFADLVGFTTLSESRDPERVRELLSHYFARCREVMAGYGGVVEKFIGDAVMAVWGAPVAHEDDAERAVRAGVDLAAMVAELGRELGAPLALRVGIVTGEVAATLGAASEGMVAGDSVNTASRVQTAAQPGQVWVDSATRSLTAHTVEYTDTGQHNLKGRAAPVRLFAVQLIRAERSPGHGLEVPMVGREDELALMQDLFTSAASDRRPRLIVVEGDAGVGKSRLVQEFERWLDAQPYPTHRHRGRCLSYGTGVAFRGLTQAVRTRLGLVDGDAGPATGERLDAALAGLTADADERAWLRPRLAVLIGSAREGNFGRGELFAAWTRFFELVGDGQPVLLVIDDAHHADDGLLDFVDHVMTATRTAFVVIAMARPALLEGRPGWGGRHTAMIPLHPLPHGVMTQLVATLLGGVPAATRDTLAARTGGNPLFAVETVRSLVDEQLAVVANGRATVLPGAAGSLTFAGTPASLRSLVRARLDTLSEAERHLVADAAVLGLTCTLDGLAALAADRVDLAGTVASLRRREILTVEDDPLSGERGHLRFTHAVVRQVAYETLSRRHRKARHMAAADHIAAEPDHAGEVDALIAQHLLDALDAAFDDDPDRDHLADQARSRLMRAGDHAARLGAPGRARRAYEHAADLTRDDGERAALHVKAAQNATSAGEQSEAIDLASEALAAYDRLGDRLAAADAVAALARALNWAGRYAEMAELLRQRLSEVESTPGGERQAFRLLEEAWVATVNLGGMREGDDVAQRLYERGRDSADPDERWSAYMALASVCDGRKDRRGTIAAYEACVRIGRDPGITFSEVTSLINLSVAHAPEDPTRSLSIIREAIALARRRGLRNGLEWAQAGELEFLLLLGRFAEMGRALERLSVAELTANVYYQVISHEAWHAAATGQPRPDRKHDRPIESVISRFTVASTRLASADISGDVDAAAAAAHDALDNLRDVPDATTWAYLPLPARAAAAAGDGALATRVLDLMEQIRSDDDPPMQRGVGTWLRGSLHATRGSDTDSIAPDLSRGISELRRVGTLGYAALALADLGCWLLSHGRAVDAAPILEQADRELQEIGAYGWRRAFHRRRTSPNPWSGN